MYKMPRKTVKHWKVILTINFDFDNHFHNGSFVDLNVIIGFRIL